MNCGHPFCSSLEKNFLFDVVSSGDEFAQWILIRWLRIAKVVYHTFIPTQIYYAIDLRNDQSDISVMGIDPSGSASPILVTFFGGPADGRYISNDKAVSLKRFKLFLVTKLVAITRALEYIAASIPINAPVASILYGS